MTTRRMLCLVVVAIGCSEPQSPGKQPAAAATTAAIPATPATELSTYERFCLACHGERGDGAGPAAPWQYPTPRDFTQGTYKWRSTASGQPPTDEDIALTIRRGVARGTRMPGYEGILNDAQVRELVAVVKGFAPERFAAPPKPVAIPSPPSSASQDIERGRALFTSAGCIVCHGTSGRGDGPTASQLRLTNGRPAVVPDLVGEPLPHSETIGDVYRVLLTGVDGTPMPSFATLPAADLWALASFVHANRYVGPVRPGPPPLSPHVPRAAAMPGLQLAAQKPPPANLPPAARELSAHRCGRCHAKQFREWQSSVHAFTASSAEVWKPESVRDHREGVSPRGVAFCKGCHAPLPEDLGHIDDANLPPRGQLPHSKLGGPNNEPEGVTCAVCHVRDHVRHGPPNPSATLAKIPNYPVVYDKRYMRSDFCLPCHMFPPENNLDNAEGRIDGSIRPVADVYMEWLFGPYGKRGVQCQSCHMPNREHTWKGGRDTETVRQGISMAAALRVEGDALSVEVKLANVGCGHFFPGGWEAAAYVVVELVNAKDKIIAKAEDRIGRDLVRGKSGWLGQVEDTRIPPEEEFVFAPSFEPTVARAADRVRVTFMMSPADNRVRIFGKKLVDTKGASAEDLAYYRTQLEYYKSMQHDVYRQELPIGKPRAIPAKQLYPKQP